MTATLDPVTDWLGTQRSFGAPAPEMRAAVADESEAWTVARQHADNGAVFVSIVQLDDGSLFVTDTQGGRNLARWAASNAVGWREIGNIGHVARVVDPSTLVSADGRRMPWTSATAAGKGLPIPPFKTSVVGNRQIGGPIHFNFAAGTMA